LVVNQPDGQPGRRGCGHASVPHTADLRIQAWGPTREDCIAEAVRGLVESFADISEARPQRVIECRLDAGSDADLLACAVEEVIYYLDTEGAIPAEVEASRAAGGGMYLILRVVDAASAQIIGAAPKAACLSGLTCAPDASGRWLCAITIDV
jgi:SHS2 domain-containing protein